MWIAASLSIIGFLLIYFEFFMPGGIIALLGGLSVVGGATYFASLPIALGWKITYFLLTFVFTALTCKMAIYFIQSRKNNKFLLEESQEGYVASVFDERLIDTIAEVITDLKPSGHILVEGVRHQAKSDGDYLQKGTKIQIIGGQGAYLLVKEKK
ncbi:MAG: NfeD family protein [Simkaniaceae bacterium]|nr:NfeD family protein [Candidatus Sacchlamyda saccharinae]